MANKKLKRKAKLRYDRIIGCVAVIGLSVMGFANMFATEVEAIPNPTKDIVATTKEYVKSVDEIDLDKVKVDYKANTGELVVNLLLGTTYEYRSDVLADSYKVALGVIEELTNKYDSEITTCKFDIDLNVATTYEIVVKQITDFEVADVDTKDWSTYTMEAFEDDLKVTKKY